MTVFYQGPLAYITHEVFETRSPHLRSFAVRDIGHLFQAHRTGGAAPTQDRTQVRAGSAGLAGAAAVITAIGWPLLNSASMPAVATVGLASVLIAVLVLSLLFAAWVWIRPVRVHELWAVYQGDMTCLFESTDEREFGQVRRALVRAMEQIEDSQARL